MFKQGLRLLAHANHKPPKGMPLFIPRAQAYFWTREWQVGEREADQEIREGKARTFDNSQDAIRWLQDDA
jgi:hypothetical protein